MTMPSRGCRSDNKFPEPIAVIGIGCRFPGGAEDPDSFWRLLRNGGDAITEVPRDRWNMDKFFDPDPGKPGKSYSRWGGFIQGIDLFDPEFFGISPREAPRMDPQQRILLEVAWEALEDAGLAIDRRERSPTGVYVGISSWDYSKVEAGLQDMETCNSHTGTGLALSIVANRISHALNFTGPSMAVDTACSSSLVAVDLACQCLWNDECPVALAGGVNVILNPESYVIYSRLSMLSPDGRCMAFDARANGFVKGEGAGIVVLKRLSRAIADKDRIYATILGTGVNQDGRTPGITVPSLESQQDLLRSVLGQAHIAAKDVSYFEAHGTGTLVGDPIEALAIGTVLGENRPPDQWIHLGSVKTNIGHLEAAAGIAGLIKICLMIQNRSIPPNLHFLRPNPDIDFNGLKLKVPIELTPWPEDHPVMAAINSFGFGGTNASAVLADPPKPPPSNPVPSSDWNLLILSAHTGEALRSYAESVRTRLAGTEWDGYSLEAICAAAVERRASHPRRLSLAANSRDCLIIQLDAFLKGEACQGLFSGQALSADKIKIAFVYAGQGPQWWGMGRELFETNPVFRGMIRRCHDLMKEYASWSLLEEFTATESRSRMQKTAIAQPSIFALQAGLTEIWKCWGIRPDAVVGHSVGEVAAAWAAGVLSLEDALRVIYHRGRCMDRASGAGRMMAVGLGRKDAEPFVAATGEKAVIAAVNSPDSVTLSGDAAALEVLGREFQSRGIFARFLPVEYAFHSHHMEGMKEDLLGSLSDIQPRQPRIPIVSTVTGKPASAEDYGPGYWWRNVRQPVLFADAVEELIRDATTIFVEISPNPVLGSAMTETLVRGDHKAWVFPSIRRKDGDRATLHSTLGALHTLGAKVLWGNLYPFPPGFIPFPKYTWMNEPFRHQSEGQRAFLFGTDANPLLGPRSNDPLPAWENEINVWMLPYLMDHLIRSHALMPGTAFLEMAIAAARSLSGEDPVTLENVRFHKALFLPQGENVTLRTTCERDNLSFQIHSREGKGSSSWQHNASGRMTPSYGYKTESVSLNEIRGRMRDSLDAESCYLKFRLSGIDYGPSFRGIRRLFRGEGEALAQIAPPEIPARDIDQYQFHPAVLDACLQAIIGSTEFPDSMSYLPVSIERIHVVGRPSFPMWSHVRDAKMNGNMLEASILVLDDEGRVLVSIQGIRCQGVEEKTTPIASSLDKMFYRLCWIPADSGERESSGGVFESGPSTAHLIDDVRRRLPALESRGAPAEIESLSAAHIINSLLTLGWNYRPGDRLDLDDLRSRLSMPAISGHFLSGILDVLKDEKLVARRRDGYLVLRALEQRDTQALFRRLWFSFPAWNSVLTAIESQSRSLPSMLAGRPDPGGIAGRSFDSAAAESLARDVPAWRNLYMLMQQSVQHLFEFAPACSRIRIFDLDPGTGAVTSLLLKSLAPYNPDYVIGRTTPRILEMSRMKFGDVPFARFTLFDPEKDWHDPEFQGHSFDLVLASMVLHDVSDAGAGLGRIRRLLRSRGRLLMIEPAVSGFWFDWLSGPAAKPGESDKQPIGVHRRSLAPSRWKNLLAGEGFEEIGDIVPRGQSAEGVLITASAPRVPPKEDGPGKNPGPPAPRAPGETRGSDEAGITPGDKWLIFCDGGGTGRKLAERLEEAGAFPIRVFPGRSFRKRAANEYEIIPDSRRHLSAVIEDIAPEGAGLSLRGIVHLWSLDTPSDEGVKTGAVHGLSQRTSLSVLSIVQEVGIRNTATPPRLWLMTRKGQTIDHRFESMSPFQAVLWGLGRVVRNEFPSSRCTLIDLDSIGRSEADRRREVESISNEILSDSREEELAFRGGRRFIRRLMRAPLIREQKPRIPGSTPDGRPFRLRTSQSGALDTLNVYEDIRRTPDAGEIEIEVQAAGLNFSDVMKALSLYPGLPEGKIPLGIECSGIVSRVGTAVRRFKPGDRVFGLAQPSFGNYVTVLQQGILPIPDRMSFAEAATVPIAFLTAYFGLVHAARLRKGERVLIHSATGGVGLAAIQVAQDIGAEIYATAGTDERRELLRGLGIDQVMDSRSLGFAEEIRSVTGGRGVDVVLNSLSGEALLKGLSALSSNGRFIEIGKRDIYQDRPIGLLPFRNNLSFIAVDLDKIIRDDPDMIGRMMKIIARKLSDGTYSPLPFRLMPLALAQEAFRCMAQAKHIGKIVLTIGDHSLSVESRALPSEFKPDATYLIIGGFGGFGLRAAKWLAGNGATHIALMGRSGPSTEEAREALRVLQTGKTRVMMIQGDAASEADMASALARIRAEWPPIRGVIHSAMVLDDAILADLDRDRMLRVMDPKVKGAWNLHRMTKEAALDFFILFSSVSSIIGNPGQGNYAAANAFLDGLSCYRRSLGLPALTVNWGYLSETGVLARNRDIAIRFENQGIAGFTPDQAFDALGRLLRFGEAEMTVVDIDWPRWMDVQPNFRTSATFAHLGRKNDGPGQDEEAEFSARDELLQVLIQAAPGERLGLLESALLEQTARILGTAASKMDKEKPLTEHGFDSLMAVELRNWVDHRLKIAIPTMEIMRGPSISEFARRLLALTAGSEDSTQGVNGRKSS
jgi:acyl transferase domain-containing protein/NADPH:quinone reductase-like Zn-dependent oxidoreductase